MNKILTSHWFYDEISRDYNSIMETASNIEVRKKIAQIFTTQVNGKFVMDFGGGTGADLPWLVNAQYKVYFCEPSEGMRGQAQEWVTIHANSQQVIILKDAGADFNQWNLNDMPFDQKMDGVLANFAVINCIGSIELLFEKISWIIKPQRHFFCIVIDTRFQKRFIRHPLKSILNLFTGKTMITTNKYLNISHNVYLHTPDEIKRKSSPYFKVDEITPLGGYGFLLIRLKRTT